MSNMPQMPSIRSSQEDNLPSSISGGPSIQTDGPFESLEVPAHEEVKPVIANASELSSEVKIPQAPKQGIEVVALRKGFYNQTRIKEGDKFKVKSFDKVGSWMKILDPVLAKEFELKKKAKK